MRRARPPVVRIALVTIVEPEVLLVSLLGLRRRERERTPEFGIDELVEIVVQPLAVVAEHIVQSKRVGQLLRPTVHASRAVGHDPSDRVDQRCVAF
jgi:hypothetical protein